MIKVLIVSGNPNTLAIYRRAFEELGCCCEESASIDDMYRQLMAAPFNGVVLDVLTKSRATQDEKGLLQEVSEVYPTLLIRWNTALQQLGGMVIGEFLDRQAPLQDYLDRFCRTSRARIFREDKRYPLHFNVLLSKEEEFTESRLEKTVTLDVSRNGCFLISSRDWRGTDTAWIRFLELADPTPMRVQIRRYLPWGELTRVPGIGVSFADLQPGQLEEIHQYCSDL